MRNFLFLLLVGLFTVPLYAIDPVKIIEEAEDSFKGETSKGIFKMKIVRPEYTREMKMKAWWKGNKYALIEVLLPAKDKGNKTLKRGNEMWNYLENTETTLKIPPSMMLQSWNGSDLTNDDIVRESKLTRDYNIKYMFDEKIGVLCWKFELTPKPDAPVVWDKLYYWVRQKDKLPALVQYYDEDGTLVRTFEFSDYQKMGGRVIPTKWKVVDNQDKGEYTTFIYEDVKFNIDIPNSKFSFRELER